MDEKELRKMNDEELDKLLPEGLDIGNTVPDYSKTVEENREITRAQKINAILRR